MSANWIINRKTTEISFGREESICCNERYFCKSGFINGSFNFSPDWVCKILINTKTQQFKKAQKPKCLFTNSIEKNIFHRICQKKKKSTSLLHLCLRMFSNWTCFMFSDAQQAVDDAKVDLPKSVQDIMNTWVLQMGFPVVTIDTASGSVSQKHFLLDPDSIVTAPSPYKYVNSSLIFFQECLCYHKLFPPQNPFTVHKKVGLKVLTERFLLQLWVERSNQMDEDWNRPEPRVADGKIKYENINDHVIY